MYLLGVCSCIRGHLSQGQDTCYSRLLNILPPSASISLSSVQGFLEQHGRKAKECRPRSVLGWILTINARGGPGRPIPSLLLASVSPIVGHGALASVILLTTGSLAVLQI